ncbi:MAG: TonB family protein [Cyanobacteria bacterium J06634_6]
MSLSNTCLKQYAKEDALTKRLLFQGLFAAVGVYAALLGLMAAVPAKVMDKPDRIALVVTGPSEPTDAVIEEALLEASLSEESLSGEISPKEPTESLTEIIQSEERFASARAESARAELATKAQASAETFASPAPTSPAQLLPPGQSDLPGSSEPANPIEQGSETPPNMESSSWETESLETRDSAAVSNADSRNIPDSDALRRLRNRLSATRGNTSGSTAERETIPTDSSGTGADIPHSSRPSENHSLGSGDGSQETGSDRNSSDTVACRRCVRAEYDEEALEAGVEGAAIVNATYDENGKVTSVSLQQSSGNDALDRAAMQAARETELETGGRSGSVPIETDFGITASARERDERRRREIESVSRPAPEVVPDSTVVQEPLPDPLPSTPASSIPEASDSEVLPTPAPDNSAPVPDSSAPVPESSVPATSDSAPPPMESSTSVPDILPPSDPVAPLPEPIAPTLPAAPLPAPVAPPEAGPRS